MNKKIQFEDLNTGLKYAIVGGYMALISFVIGFIIGISGAL